MAKKNFKESNPAMAYITAPDPEDTEAEEKTPASKKEAPATPKNSVAGYRPAPGAIETKTQRVQLLLQPSVVEDLKKTAVEMGLSMNEAASRAIKEFIEREGKE